MFRRIVLALVAVSSLSAAAHAAESTTTRQVRALVAEYGRAIPVLATVNRQSDDGEAQEALAQSSGRILVMVDGMLIEMNAEMVAALIRSGIFKVVGDLPRDFEIEYGPFF